MKRFLLSLILCLSIILNYSFIETTMASAAGTVTATSYTATYNLYDSLKYKGSIPSSSATATFSLSLSDVSSSQYANVPYSRLFSNSDAGTIVLKLCDSSGVAYNTSVSNGTYTVTDEVPGVKAISYNDKMITLSVAETTYGDITLHYYGEVTEAGVGTYQTSVATYTITVSNQGLYYSSAYGGRVTIDADDVSNYTFDVAFAKQYVLGYYGDGTFTSKDDMNFGAIDNGNIYIDGVIDPALFNESQYISAYRIEGLFNEIEYCGRIEIYIEDEVVIADTISFSINGTSNPTTSADSRYSVPASLGQPVTLYITSPSGVANVHVALSGNDNFHISQTYTYAPEDTEQTNPLSIKVDIRQYTNKLESANLNLVLQDSTTTYSETVYLVVSVTSTQGPVITLYSDRYEVSKGETLEDLDTLLREYVDSITLYDGSYVDVATIKDSTKLIITHNPIDPNIAGEHTINYSFTDPATSLTGTATMTLAIIDASPEIISVVARYKEDSSNIPNNYSVPMGTEVYFVVNATDIDGDDITYTATVQKGTLEHSHEDLSVFNYTPSQNMSGELAFTFMVSDGYSTSENYIFTITFEDNLPPTLELTNDIVYDDQKEEYFLTVDRGDNIWFNNYIQNVSDNSSSLSTNDVTITPTGFSFDAPGTPRYTFRTLGDYSVRYSVSDDMGNATSIDVKIIVSNEAPEGQDKSYEYAYGQTISLDISSLGSDDMEGFEFLNSGKYVFKDRDDESEENVLVPSTFTFDEHGNINLALAPVYNEGQDRDVPYIGNVYIKYTVIDSDGIRSPQYILTIAITDKTAPVATKTAKRDTFIKGRTYPDFTLDGYFTAFDEVDGDLTPISVKLFQNGSEKQTIDFTSLGEYQLTYTFKDSSNNEIQRTTTLNVVAGGKPTIVMLNTEAKVDVGGKFNIYDFIYKITDEEDGDIESGWAQLRDEFRLNIDDSAVDTSKAGKYTIKLYYVDDDGNASDVVEFTLIVEGKKEFPMEIIYYGAAALGLILAVVVIRIIVVKRRMRI